jgi:hypothetical protein
MEMVTLKTGVELPAVVVKAGMILLRSLPEEGVGGVIKLYELAKKMSRF